MTNDKSQNFDKLYKAPESIQTMFNMIAGKYDFINDIMSLKTHRLIKKNCIKNLNIKPHDNVIDLCCGTGDLARIIKKYQPLACVTGIDFSYRMLEIAKNKSKNINYFEGDVTNLPYSDNSFDFAVMGFGLRNIQNAEKAIEEVYRILKPGGQFLHLDFGKKTFVSKIFDKIIPPVVSLFTDNKSAYAYLIKSKQNFLPPDDLIKDFESKGFKPKKKLNYFGIISAQVMVKTV